MSGSNEVKVTITGDATSLTTASKTAADAITALGNAAKTTTTQIGQVSAAQFRAAMEAAGNSTKALLANLEALASPLQERGTQLGSFAGSIIGAAAAAQQASVRFSGFVTDGIGRLPQAFLSAEQSAQTFIAALNPTPLQALRRLTGDDLPAGFRMTQTATQGAINALLGLDREFASAAASAQAFNRAIDPTPLAAFRASMTAMAAGNKVAQVSTEQAIASVNGIGAGFKSAAQSADVFSQQIGKMPLSALRASLNDTATAGSLTFQSLQQNIDAANRVGGSFKSAADSASVFNRALDPTPLTQLRTLMGEAASSAVNFQAVINATTGVDRAFKSAAESADVFNRQITYVSQSGLRDMLLSVADAGNATFQSLQQNVDAANGIGRSFKSASDSAQVFSKALDPTPLRTLRTLMADDVPSAAQATTRSLQATIDASFGFGTAFKSAAESADVFSREVNRIPLAQLRSNLSATATTGRATVQSLQQNIDAANRIGVTFKSAADSAGVFSRALDGTISPLAHMKSLMVETEPAAQHAHTGIAGITRELIVLGHEGVTGLWSRIPGSLMVLAERSGFVTSKLGELALGMGAVGIAGTAGAAAVAAGLALIVVRAFEARTALNEVTAAAALMGRSTELAAQSATRIRNSLEDAGMGHSDIDKVNASVARTPGLSDATREAFGKLAPALQAAFPEDTVEKYFHPLMAAAAGGASAVRTYLQQIDGLTDANIRGLAVAESQNDKQAASVILIAAMQTRLDGYNVALAKRKQMLEEINVPGADFAPVTMGMLPQLKLPMSAAPEAAAQSADSVRQAEDEQKLLAPMNDRVALERTIGELTAKTKTATGEELSNAQRALKFAQDKLATMKDPGDASWVSKIATQAAEAADAKVAALGRGQQTERQMRITELTAELAVYNTAAAEKGHTDAQYNAIRSRIAHLNTQLVTAESGESRQAAHKSLEDKLSALSAEQAAEYNNFAKVMQLEAQKVALLQAAGSVATKQFNEELIKQRTMQREHDALLASQALQQLATDRSITANRIAEKKDELNEEFLENKITKQQELTELRAFAAEQHAIDLTALADKLATFADETKARTAALQEQQRLSALYHRQDMDLARQAEAQQAAVWSRYAAPVENAMSSQINAVMRGNETIGQGARRLVGDIIVGYTEMAAKEIILEQAKNLRVLVMGSATQATKTSTAAAGSAARTAIGTQETAAENAGLLVRIVRWIATQIGMTAGSAAGATARAGVMTAEQVAAAATNKLFALTQIVDSSVVAGAAAFADSASLGPPGLAAAPAVAAGAAATVLAMSSGLALESGAWNLPSNMNASLHAGEMVVPKNFADGLRSGGGGGSSTQNLNFSPKVSGGAGDIGSMLRQQAASMKSYMWHATRNGALSVPGRG